MAMVNLTRMDVAALLKLRGEIDRQLSTRRQQLEKQLSHLGVRQGGPGQGRRGRVSSLKGRKAPIKYRDKSGNVWAGRGAQPKWLTAAIKAGAKRDDFLVDKSARKAAKKKTRKIKRRRSKR
jgi:DNA-binding protein H-NS